MDFVERIIPHDSSFDCSASLERTRSEHARLVVVLETQQLTVLLQLQRSSTDCLNDACFGGLILGALEIFLCSH